MLLRGGRIVAATSGRSAALRGLSAGRYTLLVIRGDKVVTRQKLRV